jgi:hypothetical protein
VHQCQACELGYSTNAALGSVACEAYVAAGFRWVDSAPQACPKDTYAPLPRVKETATTCTACSTGWSTAGATQSTSCGEYVAAGYLYNGTSTVACGQDFFSPSYRPLTDAGVGACTKCGTGYSTGALTTQIDCKWHTAVMMFSMSVRQPQPALTYKLCTAAAPRPIHL